MDRSKVIPESLNPVVAGELPGIIKRSAMVSYGEFRSVAVAHQKVYVDKKPTGATKPVLKFQIEIKQDEESDAKAIPFTWPIPDDQIESFDADRFRESPKPWKKGDYVILCVANFSWREIGGWGGKLASLPRLCDIGELS